jgi:lysophospholipase L1-like esterase
MAKFVVFNTVLMRKSPLLWLGLTFLAACSSGARHTNEATLERYARDITVYEMGEQEDPPPEHPILFIGSSSIRLWDSLQVMFPDKPVLNRGFGGAVLTDLIYFFDRVVKPYHPVRVVIYCGDNDIARGYSPRQVTKDFRELFNMIRGEFPGAGITYISIKPSPARWDLWTGMRKANHSIFEFLARQENTSYLDLEPIMVDRDRNYPRPDIFRPDSLHLNHKGYAAWAEALRPLLDD